MNFHFDRALQIFLRTLPFVLLRLAASLAVILMSIAWFGFVFLLFRSWPFPGPAWPAWLVGAGVYLLALRVVRAYLLYLVKAGHVAVITQLVLHDSLPADAGNQIGYGVATVRRHFLRVSVLFGVDRLVHAVVRAFNRTAFRLLSFLPGSRHLEGFTRQVLDYSAGYVDEAILSYTLTRQGNPWLSARDGLILYVQNWKTVLASGLVLALISYGLTALFVVPAAFLAWGIPSVGAKIAGGVLGITGLLVKFALVDPFALTSVIVNYHIAIARQTPDPGWARKLGEASSRFREFTRQADRWTGPPSPASPPLPPAGD